MVNNWIFKIKISRYLEDNPTKSCVSEKKIEIWKAYTRMEKWRNRVIIFFMFNELVSFSYFNLLLRNTTFSWIVLQISWNFDFENSPSSAVWLAKIYYLLLRNFKCDGIVTWYKSTVLYRDMQKVFCPCNFYYVIYFDEIFTNKGRIKCDTL
jgi:hypothetical protein